MLGLPLSTHYQTFAHHLQFAMSGLAAFCDSAPKAEGQQSTQKQPFAVSVSVVPRTCSEQKRHAIEADYVRNLICCLEKILTVRLRA